MKANEAPVKIYVDSKAIGDYISTNVLTSPQDYPTCTEYIRTDAFIEKAVSYIQQNWIWNTKIIEDFKNHMKGE